MARLGFGCLVNPSDGVIPLTGRQSLEMLHHSVRPKGARQILRNGNRRTIDDRNVHSNAIAAFDLCGSTDLGFDPEVMAPASDRKQANEERHRIVHLRGDQNRASCSQSAGDLQWNRKRKIVRAGSNALQSGLKRKLLRRRRRFHRMMRSDGDGLEVCAGDRRRCRSFS